MKRPSELDHILATPYLCMKCAQVQFRVAGTAPPGNCDKCEHWEVAPCGPRQNITFVVWSPNMSVAVTQKTKVRRIK